MNKIDRILTCCDCRVVVTPDTFPYCVNCQAKRDIRATRYTCAVCDERKVKRFFTLEDRLYGLHNIIRLACNSCVPLLQAMPYVQALPYIRKACKSAFKDNSIIYVLRETDTRAIRYVGQTQQAAVTRLREHKRQAWPFSYEEALKGAYAKEGKILYDLNLSYRSLPYTEGPWLYDLKARGASIDIEVVERVADGPLLIEREIMWMLYAIRFGCKLVNTCMYNPDFVAFARNAPYDFLVDSLPLDTLASIAKLAGPGSFNAVFIREHYIEPDKSIVL